MTLRYAKIKKKDVANGPGIRLSIFLQGCPHHCKGCFNPETWDPNGGEIFSRRVKFMVFEELKSGLYDGVSILGGEPMLQARELYWLLAEIKDSFPELNIWLWTGYKYEENMHPLIDDFVDVVVDGEYIEEQRNLMLEWRGSENQRVIEVKTGKVLYGPKEA